MGDTADARAAGPSYLRPHRSREDTMTVATTMTEGARARLLAGLPTAVLEGGSGPTVVLLHEPGGFAAHWMRILPDLTRTHRVVVPDLPGHGASGLPDVPLDADRLLAWVGELIAHAGAARPT